MNIVENLSKLPKFLTEDPAGMKLKEIAKETIVFAKMMRPRVRAALKTYIKRLLDE